MMKKILTFGVAAGMLTIGAASASSLGGFDEPTLATSTVELTGCAADNGSISFTTAQEADADTQPVQVWVDEMTVSGLGEDCDGKSLGGQLVKDANGADKNMGYFGPATVTGGSATVDFFPAKRVSAEQVEKVVLIATD